MPAALGPDTAPDQRAGIARQRAQAGYRAGAGIACVSRTTPPAAPRPRATGQAANRQRDAHLVELALVAAPLPVLSRAAAAPTSGPAAPGRCLGLAVPSADRANGDWLDHPGRDPGDATMGQLHPCRGGIILHRRPVQLCPGASGGKNPARARPCPGSHAPGLARRAHGCGVSGVVANALHRHRRKLEAQACPPAPGDRFGGHRHRTVPGGFGDPWLGRVRRWRPAQRPAVPGDHQLGAVPGTQCQPLHALRRLFHPQRPA
ncbi:hypothetical protein D3C79_766630 [compost metagenome]